MALIPVVGRKTLKMRAFVGLLYLVLSLGAVTMVYPFLVMLGSSVTSQYEKSSYDIIPRYLRSDEALFGKYAEDKYKGDMGQINAAYGMNYAGLQDVKPPASVDAARVHDWDKFAQALPARYKTVGFMGAAAAFSPSPLLDRYHQYLSDRFHADVSVLDRTYNQEDEQFQTVFPPFEQPTKHNWTPDGSPKSLDWKAFQATLPANYFIVVGADPLYRKWLKEEAHTGEDAGATLSARPEGESAQRQNWETFVRTKMPFRYVRVAPSALPAYQAYLRGRYKNDVADFNAKYGVRAASFADVRLPDPDAVPSAGPPLLDWIGFLRVAPLAALTADTPETRWRTLAPGQSLPVQASDWAYVQAHTGALRRDFVTRNYSLVIEYVLLHGRAVWVTVIFCLLSILTTLLVNPLCAYALSRYNLSYGNAVLVFLLATMSFPGEISLIQNFLLLKQFNLLNTFYALILPGAASGYTIFLMKGFFDSLPRELYEAGTLDGASELRMFRDITLPLSRPIFAYISFIAFTAAYGGFLYAMTICQDRGMWTLMVWIYELQTSGAPMYVMMAALTLAAVPTLLAFMLAQKVIMKGIILPSFK